MSPPRRLAGFHVIVDYLGSMIFILSLSTADKLNLSNEAAPNYKVYYCCAPGKYCALAATKNLGAGLPL